MRLFIIFILSGLSIYARAQQTVTVQVFDAENKTPVAASIIIKGSSGFTTDSSGKASVIFPANGNFTLVVSAVGFEEKLARITIPFNAGLFEIELEHSEHEMEEVIVQSTRTSRTIANVPTRVETIELEEIDEKSNMRPSNVAMILHESTGIQVQQ